ncbi:MAG: prolyl oligopeptidase family serine peptidase [Planctomycetes bacterium]|nr:prolyl oligopeptidase family serine peptidase [Planctomycetota bacterium]
MNSSARIALALALAAIALLFAAGGPPGIPGAFADGPTPKKPWGDKERKAAVAFMQKYVQAKPADRPALLAEAAALDVPADQVAKLAPKAFELIAAAGPKSDGKGENRSKEHGGRYLLQNQSRGTGAQAVPLVIGLHGGGAGVGDAGSAASQWSGAGGKGAICVFPQVLEALDETEWYKQKEQQYLLALIEEVKHTYRIDTNHIYVVGHSMGGFGTWSLAGHHSDLFAAAASGAGGPIVAVEGGKGTRHEPGQLENYFNLPIWFFHGTDDQQVPVEPDRYADDKMKEWKYEHVYKEYPKIGHGFPPDGVKPILDWLFTKSRNPLPKKIVWYPTRTYHTHSFWLSVAEPVGMPFYPSRIEATRDGNKLDVTCKPGSPKLSVWLNEKMVDLTKPVTITLNGEQKWNSVVTPSFADALESIVDRNDVNLWFPARVKLY